MFKRFVILGLVLLLAGSAAMRWVLAEKRKEQQQTAHYQSKYGSELGKEMQQYDEWLRLPAEKRTALPPVLDKQGRITTKAQLQQQQQGRLKADLDKLAGGQSDAQALADFLYGDNWQQELNKYKGQQEQKELILNGSIVCTSIGGAIFTGCLLLYTVRFLVGVSSHLGRLLTGARKDRKQVGKVGSRPPTGDGGVSPPSVWRASPSLHSEIKTGGDPPWAGQAPQLPTGSGAECGDALQVQPSAGGVGFSPPTGDGGANPALHSQSKKPLKTLFSARRPSTLDPRSPSGIGYRTSGIQHPTAGVTQTTTEAPDPLNNTLVELTQQVAAIREYASTQQDRVQKLQEGYDWNIIRNFCLRVIRCIDNVENRIRERAGQNGEAVHLREIRDELLFAMESSGIEQFEPEINSDYRGQEKHIEAAKERESCDDPDLAGKIARVIRPGYHYFVDDKHVKIVRPAMVMLFG